MEEVTNIAYADDLVLIVEAINVRDLVFKTNESLEAIVKRLETNAKLKIKWMNDNLSFGAHTEYVVSKVGRKVNCRR